MGGEPRQAWPRKLWAIPVVLLVLYPLSMGPIWRIASDETIDAVYAPLIWASEHCEPLHAAMNSYLRLWGRGIYFLLDSDSVLRRE
jgi:hypothetical protein